MSTLLVMGCDPHLDTITAAVTDPTGGEVDLVTVPNDVTGWDRLAALAARHGIEQVGIEGASGYGRRLAETVTRAGIEVREMPTRLTARLRRIDGAGKTDAGDAVAIARAVARGEGNRWTDHDTLEAIRVTHSRREHLVRAQTADINQLRALIAEIDPAAAAALKRLRSARQFRQLTEFQPSDNVSDSRYRQAVTHTIHDIARTCLQRLEQIRHLTRGLDKLMPAAGHELTAMHGCDTVTAARVLAELAGTDGFATDAKMAAWAGTAPLDASSGRQQRHRLNRRGNRQVNRAIHTIVLTQLRQNGQAAHYIARRVADGKTEREAIRAAKRHVTRHIWKTLHNHQLT